MTGQAELDQAIADLKASVSGEIARVAAALEAKSTPAVDLSAEVADLNALKAQLDSEEPAPAP